MNRQQWKNMDYEERRENLRDQLSELGTICRKTVERRESLRRQEAAHKAPSISDAKTRFLRTMKG